MTEWKPTQTQIEAAARADGFHESNLVIPERGVMWIDREGCYYGRENLPDYANDHNAVQRLIDGLSIREQTEYATQLCFILGFGFKQIETRIDVFVSATASQKFQAVCKAKGWE